MDIIERFDAASTSESNVVDPEPSPSQPQEEKPKRRRRTKAEMEAERQAKAAEAASVEATTPQPQEQPTGPLPEPTAYSPHEFTCSSCGRRIVEPNIHARDGQEYCWVCIETLPETVTAPSGRVADDGHSELTKLRADYRNLEAAFAGLETKASRFLNERNYALSAVENASLVIARLEKQLYVEQPYDLEKALLHHSIIGYILEPYRRTTPATTEGEAQQ